LQRVLGKHPAAALRVVTWNVHGCAAGLTPVVEELRRLDADVICLQEAEVGTTHTGGVDQADTIARQLGMHHYAAGSELTDGGGQCMAILYRHELCDPGDLDAGTGRIYGVTAVIEWQGRSLHIASVHLTSTHRRELKHAVQTTGSRLEEATDLAHRAEEWSAGYIIAGDLNSFPGMPAYDALARRFPRSATTQPTYPSSAPTVSIDQIFCSPGLHMEQPVVGDTMASDHLPVVAEIARPKPSSGR